MALKLSHTPSLQSSMYGDMHRTWEVPELVLAILEFLERSDQARMARVRRSFWPAAVRSVWKRLPNLLFLVRLLPRSENMALDAAQRDPAPFFSPDLQSGDWDRFILHAPLVKGVIISVNREDVPEDASPGLLAEIHSNGPLPKLLPKLTSLRLNIDTPKNLKFDQNVPSMLSPSLQTFEMEFLCNNKFVSSAIPTITRHIRDTLSNLVNLSIKLKDDGPWGPAMYEDMSAAIQAQPHLNQLALRIPGPIGGTSVMDAIQKLPVLTSLQFFCNSFRLSYLPPGVFHALKFLILNVDSGSVGMILSRVDPLQLIELVLSSYFEPQNARNHIDYDGIAKLQNLRKLSLSFRTTCVSWKLLQPLLSCTKLKSCRLKMRTSFSPSNAHLHAFAKAWPHLRTFKFLHEEGGRPWRATLQGLDRFGKYCRSLETLEVPINLSGGGGDARPGARISTSVKRINFLSSKTPVGCDKDAVARMICSMWPKHRKRGTYWTTQEDLHDTDSRRYREDWTAIWDKVVAMLQEQVA